jgi:hypothetical protein
MNYDYDTNSLPHCLQWQTHANNSLNNNEKKTKKKLMPMNGDKEKKKNHIIRKYEWEYAMGFKVMFFFLSFLADGLLAVHYHFTFSTVMDL